MASLVWLEETAFSTWMRESGPAFFSSLAFHSVAMGFVVGVHVATNLRILGVAPRVTLSLMRNFFLSREFTSWSSLCRACCS